MAHRNFPKSRRIAVDDTSGMLARRPLERGRDLALRVAAAALLPVADPLARARVQPGCDAPAVFELLDDPEPLVLLHQTLDLGNVVRVPRRDEEAARVCAHRFVLLHRQADPLRARGVSAFAYELTNREQQAERFVELLDAFVDLPEQRLVFRRANLPVAAPGCVPGFHASPSGSADANVPPGKGACERIASVETTIQPGSPHRRKTRTGRCPSMMRPASRSSSSSA